MIFLSLKHEENKTIKTLTYNLIDDSLNSKQLLNDTLYKAKYGIFIDERDGTKYNWVKIGNQIWMTQNLAFKMDTGCYAYKNRWKRAKKNGYLYTWEVAQIAAPNGWHVPSRNEYKIMLNNLCLDSNNNKTLVNNYYYCIKSNKNMNLNKIVGIYSPEPGILNSHYMKGLIGNEYTCYWTSDSSMNGGRNKNINSFGYLFYEKLFNHSYLSYAFNSNYGYLVRCVKDSIVLNK